MISTNLLRFDVRTFFNCFDFGVNFSWKTCLRHGFIIRLEPLLTSQTRPPLGHTKIEGESSLTFVASLVAVFVGRRSMLIAKLLWALLSGITLDLLPKLFYIWIWPPGRS